MSFDIVGIKKALNSTLGTPEFAPLDIKINSISRRYKWKPIVISMAYTSTATIANPMVAINTTTPGILRNIYITTGLVSGTNQYTPNVKVTLDGIEMLNTNRSANTVIAYKAYPANDVFSLINNAIAGGAAFTITTLPDLNVPYNTLKIELGLAASYTSGTSPVLIHLLEEAN